MTTDRPLRYSISPLKRAAVAGLLALLAGLAFAAPAQYQTGMQERPNPKTMPIMMGFERTVNLGDLWIVQSSEKVKGTGAEISKPGFKIEPWCPAVVPSTVLGTLVQNNVYRDIFVGRNQAGLGREGDPVPGGEGGHLRIGPISFYLERHGRQGQAAGQQAEGAFER